ncbi:MAG: carbohydrate-binding family 9-like protein [Planctomycetota bacterium]|jgi:hypothetical protein
MRDIEAAERSIPRTYLCFRADEPVIVDGPGDQDVWRRAPWTEDFVDIEGDRRPRPRYRTRVRMLHDDQHLHVHAELEEPHVWGTISRRNAVIFHDNDFEIFIDPDGDNHDYYELEVNALNTTWELSLPAPYRTGASPRDPDPIEGLVTAVHVDGTLNDPSDVDRGWSVQVAIPWSGLRRFAGAEQACPPRDGDRWRINFSRVQWRHEVVDGAYRRVEGAAEDNWVWSPQGVVDMHRPATWGSVQFCDAPAGSAAAATAALRPDVTLAVRNLLMGIWERQRARPEPTDDLGALGVRSVWPVAVVRRGDAWRARVRVVGPGGAFALSVDETARLVEERAPALEGGVDVGPPGA